MMQKSKYKFMYDNKTVLYDASKQSKYEKALSLFVKELYIYNVSLKNLAKETPRPIIKNELLNIAAICLEEEVIAKSMKLKRSIPIKHLSSFTGKSQKFFEKWQYYILAYFILLSNENYSSIISYLNIQETANSLDRKNTDNTSNTISGQTSSASRELTGIVLKCRKKTCYILTAYGDFQAISTTESKTIGELCTGKKTKEHNLYNTPLKAAILAFIFVLVVGFYSYIHTERIIIIKSSFNIKLEVNRWNRIIDITGLNVNGADIEHSVKLFNRPLDSALTSILNEGINQKYISENSSVNIYISGNDNTPNLAATEKFISDKKLKAIINNDGSAINGDK